MQHIMPPPMLHSQREPRLQAIRDLVVSGAVHSQHELTEQLATRGFVATQSSICRDLRELGVAKVRGCYALPAAPAAVVEDDASALEEIAPLVKAITPAGPQMLVVACVLGGASRVGAGIDAAGWPEVVGTVAGDDTLFIATKGLHARNRVAHLLDSLLRNVAHV